MELSKELFEDVIVYRMSEVGAMGSNGTLTCLKKTGESFTLDYLSEETPWPEIKKNFPGIDGCPRAVGYPERIWHRHRFCGIEAIPDAQTGARVKRWKRYHG